MSNTIHVTFRHVDSSQALKDYVTEKLGRVLKLHDRACDAHVTLSVEKFRHIAEVFLGDKQVTIKAFESLIQQYPGTPEGRNTKTPLRSGSPVYSLDTGPYTTNE